MILEQFTLGVMENNNYLLIDEGKNNKKNDSKKDAVLIDCSAENKDIEDALKKYNADLKYILLTHGHFDHVLGVNIFKNKFNCKVLIHKNDKILLDTMKEFAARFGLPDVEIQKVDGFIDEGDIIEFGNNKIEVIHTPGHTQGCVCYLIEDKLFSGDTLFYEAIGRTDLQGGSFNDIKSSIEKKLFKLDDKTQIYPGHGWESTIGHEKINNKCL